MQKIQNAIFFQITWFACVFGSANNLIWPGLLCCVAFAIWQLMPKRRHAKDIRVVILAILLGLAIDSSWVQLGLLNYSHQWPHSALAPLWIIALWVAFALTINHSLSWLTKHPLLPALMGLIGAPLSYLAGQKLGAIHFNDDPMFVLCSLAIIWALAISILYFRWPRDHDYSSN